MRKTVISSLFFFISTAACADGPRYQVSTQLGGLTVNYGVESNLVRTTLYATNHERTPILCSASIKTNFQDSSKGGETVIAPGKTTAFSFKHDKAVTDVRLYLVCEAAKNTGEENNPTSSVAPPAQEPKTEKTPIQQKPIPVVEEDLDRY